MKQIYCKHFFYANYGASTEWLPIFSGDTLSWAQVTFGVDAARVPWSCAGVIRNLVIELPVAAGIATTWTVLLNGVATALSVSLTSLATSGSDEVHDIAVVPGDDIALKLVGSTLSIPGFDGGLSLEFEGTTPNESGYGVAPFDGSINLAAPTTVGRLGGALGNGSFEVSSATPAVLSNTYSIVSTAGSIVRLDAKAYGGAPGAGVWTINLVLNTVIQDGAGGTVNTTCVMTGASTATSATFTLPVVATDHVDILIVRTGINAPFALAQVGCGVAFVSTADDRFIICGGNNNARLPSAVDYAWLGSQQQRTSESEAACPIGPTGFTSKGLYIERSTAPTAGKSWAHMLRQSAANTITTVTVADAALTGLILNDVVWASGQTIDLRITPSGTPVDSQLHWGLALSTAALPPPPPPTGVSYATRRLRQFMLPSSPDQAVLFLRRLELLLQPGVGLTEGDADDPAVQGSDPQIMLQISHDSGKTWGSERWMSAGKIGDYTRRAVWNNFGRYRNAAIRVVVTDPVQWAFLGAIGKIDNGTS